MSEQPVNMEVSDDFPGFYGKIPSLGDFVSRRLPRHFVTPWETWLREAIANSREQLGSDWLDNYLTSPLWRFALSPGICGENGWAGIVMPSVDRVGRYYPLTLAARLNPSQNLFRLMERSDGWFARMEDLALACLEDNFKVEDLDQQLRTTGNPATESTTVSTPGIMPESNAAHNAWHAHLESQSALHSIYPRFIPQLMKRLLFAYSIWWTHGSERISPSLLICQGLPHINGAGSLIDGAWGEHGWEEIDNGTFTQNLQHEPSPVT